MLIMIFWRQIIQVQVFLSQELQAYAWNLQNALNLSCKTKPEKELLIKFVFCDFRHCDQNTKRSVMWFLSLSMRAEILSFEKN